MELQAKCDNDHKIILKFTQGQENLDKLLCTQVHPLTKRELDINTPTKRIPIRISLLNLLHIKRMLEHVIIVLKWVILHTHVDLKNHLER